MTNQAKQAQQTPGIAETTRVIHIQLVVNNHPYQADVNPKEIFHEALEHALPQGLLVGHRIRISTPVGDEIFPDMFISESVKHFHTNTFHVQAIPLSPLTAGVGQQT